MQEDLERERDEAEDNKMKLRMALSCCAEFRESDIAPTSEIERLQNIESLAKNFVLCRNIKGYDDMAEKSAGWYLEQAIKDTE